MSKLLIAMALAALISAPAYAGEPSDDTLNLAAGIVVYRAKCEKTQLGPKMPAYLSENLKLLMTADGVEWNEQFAAKVDVYINLNNPLLSSMARETNRSALKTACNLIYEGLAKQ